MSTQPIPLCQWALHPHLLDMRPWWWLWRSLRWTWFLWWVFIALSFCCSSMNITFFSKYFLNTLLFCSLSAAYPTCFPLTQFTCANGRCININWRCDNGEYHPSLPHLSRCAVESNLKILRVCADVQTMTVETAATKQAAATLVPASSSNVTAAAASQNTGPATATMTVETTVTRLMPTVPTKVI